jgi:hypothetical protein
LDISTEGCRRVRQKGYHGSVVLVGISGADFDIRILEQASIVR